MQMNGQVIIIMQMENKMEELTVKVPTGYKVMNGQNIQEILIKAGVFKKVDSLANSWEEFSERKLDFDGIWSSKKYSSTNTYEALRKLELLRNHYNGDWKHDFADSGIKYVIIFRDNIIRKIESVGVNSFLAFKTEELRDEFLKNFESIIMEAKDLLG